MKPQPVYVVNQDFEDYVEGWNTTNSEALARLLARAERYIDLLGAGRPIQQADAIQDVGIHFTAPPTGGSFVAAFTINGIRYTTQPISYNARYFEVANAINGARSVENAHMPGSVQTYEGPLTPFVPSGPLPYTHIVVAFTGTAGATRISQGEIISSALTGGEGVTPFIEQVCPGGPWNGRFNPSQLLEYNQLESLKSAVCAQAEYMFNMGPKFFVEEQYSNVSGPDFSTKGKLPKIAPKARREMALAGLTVTMARSHP
jgi:hypothetical protein